MPELTPRAMRICSIARQSPASMGLTKNVPEVGTPSINVTGLGSVGSLSSRSMWSSLVRADLRRARDLREELRVLADHAVEFLGRRRAGLDADGPPAPASVGMRQDLDDLRV